MNTFLLSWVQRSIKTLNRICIFGIIEWRWSNLADSPGFAEIWVLGWLFFGGVCLMCGGPNFIFFIPAILRVWEILWRHLNILFNDRQSTNHNKPLLPIIDLRRSVLLAILNYIEIVVWFAVAYRAAWFDLDTNGTPNTIPSALYFSIVTMATVGYGEIHARAPYTQILIALQIVFGLFMVLIVLARIIGFLDKPPVSKDTPR